MPFVLIVAGVVLLVSAIRDTQQQLFFLVAGDFTGKNNFIYWFLSIVIIGAVGYIPRMKPISDGFLILVILTLFLKKGAFFDQFQQAIGSTQTARPVVSGSSGGAQFSGGGPSISITPPTVSLPGGVQIGGRRAL